MPQKVIKKLLNELLSSIQEYTYLFTSVWLLQQNKNKKAMIHDVIHFDTHSVVSKSDEHTRLNK